MSVEVTAWLMLALPRSTPVTVIVFGVLQSLELKLTAPPTVAMDAAPLVGVTVTVAVGWLFSTTL